MSKYVIIESDRLLGNYGIEPTGLRKSVDETFVVYEIEDDDEMFNEDGGAAIMEHDYAYYYLNDSGEDGTWFVSEELYESLHVGEVNLNKF